MKPSETCASTDVHCAIVSAILRGSGVDVPVCTPLSLIMSTFSESDRRELLARLAEAAERIAEGQNCDSIVAEGEGDLGKLSRALARLRTAVEAGDD